jgi:hypothetical protein
MLRTVDMPPDGCVGPTVAANDTVMVHIFGKCVASTAVTTAVTAAVSTTHCSCSQPGAPDATAVTLPRRHVRPLPPPCARCPRRAPCARALG